MIDREIAVVQFVYMHTLFSHTIMCNSISKIIITIKIPPEWKDMLYCLFCVISVNKRKIFLFIK